MERNTLDLVHLWIRCHAWWTLLAGRLTSTHDLGRCLHGSIGHERLWALVKVSVSGKFGDGFPNHVFTRFLPQIFTFNFLNIINIKFTTM